MGHIIVLMHKVINEIASAPIFSGFPMASPFRFGIEFPSDSANLGLVVMRIVNWPPHEGPRV
jgi:hypothetical protein